MPNSALVSLRESAAAARAVGLEPDAVRAALRGGGEGGGESGAPGGAGNGGPPRGRGEGGRREGVQNVGGGEPAGAGRPGLVFVVDEAGQPTPRRVRLGLSDWDTTEVLDGLTEGEQVVLVSVAQLQQGQREFADRMPSRAGGPVPGAGAPGAPGGQSSRPGGGAPR